MSWCGSCDEDIVLYSVTSTRTNNKCRYCEEKGVITLMWKRDDDKYNYYCPQCGNKTPKMVQRKCRNCDVIFKWQDMGDLACNICLNQFCKKCEEKGDVSFFSCIGCNKNAHYCELCIYQVTSGSTGKPQVFNLCPQCHANCNDDKGVFSLKNLRCKRWITHKRRCFVRVGLDRQFCRRHRYYKKKRL